MGRRTGPGAREGSCVASDRETHKTIPVNLNYLIGILCLVLWIVALVDCIKSNNSNKVVWIIVIIVLPLLGSILYFLIGRSRA